jgi:hypothetical protein
VVVTEVDDSTVTQRTVTYDATGKPATDITYQYTLVNTTNPTDNSVTSNITMYLVNSTGNFV